MFFPSTAHQAQCRQCEQSARTDQSLVRKANPKYKASMPCYNLFNGPRRDKDPWFVPAAVTRGY